MGIVLEKVSYKEDLKNFSYSFEEETITSIICSSDETKKSLCEIICGINNAFQGIINNPFKDRNIGYVPNISSDTFIFNTVKEELSFGINKYNYKKNIIDKRINDSLKMVGLPISYLNRNPDSLSLGEQKLLSIAIALSINPTLIVLDDPTYLLDNNNKEKIIKILKKITTRYKKTIIVMTNDINTVIKLPGNYIMLKKGKIYDIGKCKEIINNLDKIKNIGVREDKVCLFIKSVKKKKNVDLDMTFDIKELMKDIYRNVR